MDLDKCIICLSEEPILQKYDAPCECKPYVHQICLEQWFLVNSNECPICRVNYEYFYAPIYVPIIFPQVRHDTDPRIKKLYTFILLISICLIVINGIIYLTNAI